MDSQKTILTPFNYFEWKAEMEILLREKCLYRVTMATEAEPNAAAKKISWVSEYMYLSNHFSVLNRDRVLSSYANVVEILKPWWHKEFHKLAKDLGTQLTSQRIVEN